MRSIADIEADLAAAKQARILALQAQSYTLDTGQGRQTVQRADLGAISKLIKELTNELEEAQSEGYGLVSGQYRRW